jgi:hypothetical protein
MSIVSGCVMIVQILKEQRIRIMVMLLEEPSAIVDFILS